MRMLERLQRHLGAYVCHVLVRPWREAVPQQGRLRYAVLTDAQVLAWCRDPALGLERRQAERALRRGDVCIGGLEHHAPVCYVWYAYRAAPHVAGLWVQFDRGSAYAYKGFVRPEYRGAGLGAELYARAAEICPKKGTRRGISFIGVDNPASLRAAERAGWQRVGYAAYASAFGGMLTFSSGGAKRFGFRFYAPTGTALVTALRGTRTSAA
jgi:GNAT superfamily N-acetyltransferase